MNRTRRLSGLLCGAAAAAFFSFAQSFEDRGGTPDWEIPAAFAGEAFTFVRVQYDSYGRWDRKWTTDYPDAELNFSWRLHEMTSMAVKPKGRILRLTDPDLNHFPFIYIVEPGDLVFSQAEVDALRAYLLGGGFLMVDDFWGEDEWENFHREIKRVFPERDPHELPGDHAIFHCVFNVKEKPQIPSINHAYRARHYGITWERPDARVPHYKAITDDKGRIMAVICHNTDLGDGWEREGEDEYYFREFSEKKAYPLGINILFYAMTH